MTRVKNTTVRSLLNIIYPSEIELTLLVSEKASNTEESLAKGQPTDFQPSLGTWTEEYQDTNGYFTCKQTDCIQICP